MCVEHPGDPGLVHEEKEKEKTYSVLRCPRSVGNNSIRIKFIKYMAYGIMPMICYFPTYLTLQTLNESVVCTCSIAYMRARIGNDRLVVCLSEYLP